MGKKGLRKNSTIEQHHHDPTKGTNSFSEIWRNKAPPLVIEGSLEVKLPTIWTDEKQGRGRGREKRKIRREKSKKKEDGDARKGRKVAIHCVFPMVCGSGGFAKAAGAEPAGQRRDEKLHAVVARSTFPSQNVQNTPSSEHFWKLRCRKSARRCGAKHISKAKCTKHHVRTTFGS